MSRKVKEPLDLWIAEWEREIHERKNPFSRKPTPEERVAYELRMKEEEEEAKRKKQEEEKRAAWLRSLPYYRIRDMEILEKIHEKLAQLTADVAAAFSGLSINFGHVRNPWTIEKLFRESGQSELADRLIVLHGEERSRKFVKEMNRDSEYESD